MALAPKSLQHKQAQAVQPKGEILLWLELAGNFLLTSVGPGCQPKLLVLIWTRGTSWVTSGYQPLPL